MTALPLFMPELQEIPTVEVAIGADYLFLASRAKDLLDSVDFSALAGSAFSVEIYSLAFPLGTVSDTLTGSKITGSDVDFSAIFTDTLTGTFNDGDQRWAKLILDAGADAKGVAMIQLLFRGK